MARMRLGWRRGSSIGRVITAIVSTILILYVGGQVLMYVADSMLGTCSPFYQGLSLIGWSVGAEATANQTISQSDINTICAGSSNILYDVTGAGVLVVLGLIAVASLVLQFVEVRMG